MILRRKIKMKIYYEDEVYVLKGIGTIPLNVLIQHLTNAFGSQAIGEALYKVGFADGLEAQKK